MPSESERRAMAESDPGLRECPNCGKSEHLYATHGHGWGKDQELTGYHVKCNEHNGGCGLDGPLAYTPDDCGFTDDTPAYLESLRLWNALPRRSDIADAEERGRQGALGTCPLHIRCNDHDFFHGGEAEEFREKLEALVASNREVDPRQLQHILDTIDARDSLAYCERRDKERAALEPKP